MRAAASTSCWFMTFRCFIIFAFSGSNTNFITVSPISHCGLWCQYLQHLSWWPSENIFEPKLRWFFYEFGCAGGWPRNESYHPILLKDFQKVSLTNRQSVEFLLFNFRSSFDYFSIEKCYDTKWQNKHNKSLNKGSDSNSPSPPSRHVFRNPSTYQHQYDTFFQQKHIQLFLKGLISDDKKTPSEDLEPFLHRFKQSLRRFKLWTRYNFLNLKLKPSLVYSIDLFSQLSIFLEYMLKNTSNFCQPIRMGHFKITLKTNLRSSSHAIRQLRFPNVASSSKMVLTNCGVAKSNSSIPIIITWY